MSTTGDDKAELPIRRYKSRGNFRNIGMIVGAGLGAAMGAAIGQIGVWLGVGAGLGLLFGSLLQIRANRAR